MMQWSWSSRQTALKPCWCCAQSDCNFYPYECSFLIITERGGLVSDLAQKMAKPLRWHVIKSANKYRMITHLHWHVFSSVLFFLRLKVQFWQIINQKKYSFRHVWQHLTTIAICIVSGFNGGSTKRPLLSLYSVRRTKCKNLFLPFTRKGP